MLDGQLLLFQIVDYNGERTLDDLVKFVSKYSTPPAEKKEEAKEVSPKYIGRSSYSGTRLLWYARCEKTLF